MRRGRIIIGITAAVILTMGGTAYAAVMEAGGGQRPDETLLEGDVLTQVAAAAVAEVGSDATVVRAETDADGNAAYEVHMVTADGQSVTVYVDESYAVVSVEEKMAGGQFRDRRRDQEQLREQDCQQEQLRDQVQLRERDRDGEGDQNMTQSQTRDHFGDGTGTGMDGQSGGHDGGGSRDGGSHGGGR